MRIVYIEDNRLNLRLVQKMLKRDHIVSGALTGTEGLRLIALDPPDLILLDIDLPDIDGFSILKELRSKKDYDHIPIVALTANAMAGDRERFLAAGFDAYVPKPVTRVELLYTISSTKQNSQDDTASAD